MEFDKRRYVKIRDCCPKCEKELPSRHYVWSECSHCVWAGSKVKKKVTYYKIPEIEREELI